MAIWVLKRDCPKDWYSTHRFAGHFVPPLLTKLSEGFLGFFVFALILAFYVAFAIQRFAQRFASRNIREAPSVVTTKTTAFPPCFTFSTGFWAFDLLLSGVLALALGLASEGGNTVLAVLFHAVTAAPDNVCSAMDLAAVQPAHLPLGARSTLFDVTTALSLALLCKLFHAWACELESAVSLASFEVIVATRTRSLADILFGTTLVAGDLDQDVMADLRAGHLCGTFLGAGGNTSFVPGPAAAFT